MIHRTLIFGMFVVVAAAGHTTGAAAGELLEVRIEASANPVAGSSPAECLVSAKFESLRQNWWITFGRAQPHAEKGWEAVGAEVECGTGSWKERLSDSEAASGAPFLVAEIMTVGGLFPSSLTPERVLRLQLSLSRRELFGFTAEGEPEYRQSANKRSFFFLDRGDAAVPLFVASDTQRMALGVHEVFLRVMAGRVGTEPGSSYGVISLTSGQEGEILLDGGVVGTVSAGRETVLRNVHPGLREVGMRDSSGRRFRTVVRVEADRTVVVELNPRKATAAEASYGLEFLGKNDQGFEEYRRERDGAAVVKIPAGEFLMGNKETERTPLEHMVFVSDFLMDKTGVTWGRYKRYAAATGIPLPPRDPYWGMHDDHPAVFVTWEEAKGYCEWAGGRLPTEAEREKAARGTDGRKYPWGNEEPEPDRAVFRSEWGYKATAAVGTHPEGVSPYGLHDMGGNVWEWCSDWYDGDYFAVSPYRDPKGPAVGVARVLRGGSWDSRPSVLSASCRNWGHRGYREGDFGFRCAMNVPD